jgi:hypothetical protein
MRNLARVKSDPLFPWGEVSETTQSIRTASIPPGGYSPVIAETTWKSLRSRQNWWWFEFHAPVGSYNHFNKFPMLRNAAPSSVACNKIKLAQKKKLIFKYARNATN